MSEKTTFREWWAKNKKTVLIISGVVVATGIGIAAFKYRKVIFELAKKAAKLITESDKTIEGVATTVAVGATGASSAHGFEEVNPVKKEDIIHDAKEKNMPANEAKSHNSFDDSCPQTLNNELDEVISQLSSSKLRNNGLPYPVAGHFRKLGENRHPSLQKRQQAEAMGITLGDNITFVVPYHKNSHDLFVEEPQPV